MTLHIKLDRRHAATMGITASDVHDRIRDIEQRTMFAILAKAGRHDVVLRIVNRDGAAMQARIVSRQNEAIWGVAP
jgi:Cu/Ag efflux pump CusA